MNNKTKNKDRIRFLGLGQILTVKKDTNYQTITFLSEVVGSQKQ